MSETIPTSQGGTRPANGAAGQPVAGQPVAGQPVAGQPAARQPAAGRPRRRVTGRRALTVGLAVVAAVLVWAVAGPIAGADLTVKSGGGTQQVNGIDVALAALVASLLAWALRALLDKLTRRPGPVWTVSATIALLLSVVGPLSATHAGAMAVLALLHLLVAGILIVGLSRPATRP
jgi:hypothetical protein